MKKADFFFELDGPRASSPWTGKMPVVPGYFQISDAHSFELLDKQITICYSTNAH
jgi:hypothetical protein